MSLLNIVLLMIGVAFVLAVLVLIVHSKVLKAERRKADAIISKRSHASQYEINRLITSIERSSSATDTTISEEDRIRIEALRRIRDEKAR